jgi:hypothetical protein
MNASDREFQRELSQININTAMDIMRNTISSNNAQSMWSSYGSIANAGIQAYDKYSEKK